MTKRHVLTLFLIMESLFLQTFSVSAQKLDVQVDGQRIFNTITYMASDQFLGRRSNTPEFNELQDWVVNQYKAWKLEPAGENGTFFQSVPIAREYAVNYGTPGLVINGRKFFAHHYDFSIDTRSTMGKTIENDIVFVGYGISAPDKGLDEYDGVDVKEKIVLVLKGNPNNFIPPPAILGSPVEPEKDITENWTEESADSTKIITAYRKGAAGIILYNPGTEVNFFSRFRPGVKESPFQRDFMIVSDVSEKVFHWILWTDLQMSSRGFSTWLNGVRGDIKKKKSRSFDTKIKAEITGYEKTLLKGKKFNDDKGRNIIATITGTDPELKNQYVVLGAHFDHVGVANGQIYNGAEDNASGSAIVMEVARLMKEHDIHTKRTIIFCLWTAEELGLVGSRYWVEKPINGVTMDQVVTYINMDMVGLGNEIGAPGALNFPSIWAVITRDQDQDIMDVVKPRIGGPGGSDHSAFIELGIEALALMTGGEEGHPDYHDTGDDAHKLNPEILRKTARFVLQGTINLANETRTELLIPDRQHIYNGLQWSVTVINPDLGIDGSWSYLDVKTIDDLSGLMTQKINELKQPQQITDPFQAMMRRRFGRMNVSSGIEGADIFNHHVHLMEIGRDVLDFGRLDIDGDDDVWFDQGLTEEGVTALAAMEKKNIVLHLMNPSKATLVNVLEKAKKPFLISGFSNYDDSLIVHINDKKVLIGVDFNPEDIESCITQLETFKTKFGDTDNFLLNVISEDGLDDARKVLYQSLIKKGWKKEEIYAIGGAGVTRRSRGNLDVFAGARPAFSR